MADLVGIGWLVGCGMFIYKYIRDRCERLFTCSSYIKFFRNTHTASMDINARTSHAPYPYIYSTPYTHSRGCRATKRGSGRYENPEPTYDRLSDLSTTCSPNVHLGWWLRTVRLKVVHQLSVVRTGFEPVSLLSAFIIPDKLWTRTT